MSKVILKIFHIRSRTICILHSRYLWPNSCCLLSVIHILSWEHYGYSHLCDSTFLPLTKNTPLTFSVGVMINSYVFLWSSSNSNRAMKTFCKYHRNTILDIVYSDLLFIFNKNICKNEYKDRRWYVTVVYLTNKYWVLDICQKFFYTRTIDHEWQLQISNFMEIIL